MAITKKQFTQLIGRALKQEQASKRKDAKPNHDSYTDKQTRSHKTTNTSKKRSDKSRR